MVCLILHVWHELEDLSHRKDLQHVLTLLMMHLEYLPTTDLSERGYMPCGGRQCVCHMTGRQMTHWCYAVHAHFTQGGRQHCGGQIVQRSCTPASLVCLILHAQATVKQEGARTRVKVATLNRCAV